MTGLALSGKTAVVDFTFDRSWCNHPTYTQRVSIADEVATNDMYPDTCGICDAKMLIISFVVIRQMNPETADA